MSKKQLEFSWGDYRGGGEESIDCDKVMATDLGEQLRLMMTVVTALLTTDCDRDTVARLREARHWLMSMRDVHAKAAERGEIKEMQRVVDELREMMSRSHGGRVLVSDRQSNAVGPISGEEN